MKFYTTIVMPFRISKDGDRIKNPDVEKLEKGNWAPPYPWNRVVGFALGPNTSEPAYILLLERTLYTG